MYNTELFILFILLLICIFCIYVIYESFKLCKKYYDVNEVCPELLSIYNYKDIMSEVDSVRKMVWDEWPEKELYLTENKTWNIYPFKAFGLDITDNCEKCPNLSRFINSIPGIKIAILSRLGPGMKLAPHQGWGGHSNNVIRCHFGIDVPDGCYISVADEPDLSDEEIRYHKNGEWLCFDDSKIHYAHNSSNKDRIVLIVDVQRPSTIAKGTSKAGDTKELLDIVNYYKQRYSSSK
jgi:aspartyl/asparaginyl beta-hydroxylase (cupin superfamily)